MSTKPAEPRTFYYTQTELRELELARLKREAELQAEIDFKAKHREPDADAITISRKAAEKALVAINVREALEAELKVKDQAIAEYKKLLQDMRTEFVYVSGQNTALRQGAVSRPNVVPNNRYETILKLIESYLQRFDRVSSNAEIESPPREDAKPEGNANKEESEGAKMLATVCPLFSNAMPETRGTAWKMMENFTRKQWALFADSTGMLKSSTKVERARRIEEIGTVTNMRDLFGKQRSNEDRIAVNKVITLLNADAIKAKNA